MSASDNWLNCPELVWTGSEWEPGWMSQPGKHRHCGAPAEITQTEILQSTEGPVTHVKTRCAVGHILFCPLEAFA